MTPPVRYRDAGVDIDAGDETVRRIRDAVRSTFGDFVVSDVGAFAGLARIPGGDPDRYLVASMDGVGTKLKVAVLAGRYDTVGEDLVNHCVDDIAVHGAEPLLFLDYVAMGKLEPSVVEQVVQGLARGCRDNGCALIGGETAEMPGLYTPPDFDLAGCIIGTVHKDEVVDGSTVQPGDRLLGVPSTGLHTNGYSLARKVLFEVAGLKPEDALPGGDGTVADALLAVHRSYLPELRALRGRLKGAAHITGGGIPGNLVRVLPEGTRVRVDRGAWRVPPVFRAIADAGQVPLDDLYRTFNMGAGLLILVAAEDLERALAECPDAFPCGVVEAGPREVVLEGDPRW
jgi:phosphoribosylformylglycinamidine cyclo-ligase